MPEGEHGDKPGIEVDPNLSESEPPEEGDVGFVGGGGPASVIDPEGSEDEESHLADTDHSLP